MHINYPNNTGLDNIISEADFHLLIVNKLLLFLVSSLQKRKKTRINKSKKLTYYESL